MFVSKVSYPNAISISISWDFGLVGLSELESWGYPFVIKSSNPIMNTLS